MNGIVINESFCFKEGCYVFEIWDIYGDGICCDYGDGYYVFMDISGLFLAIGGEYGIGEEVNFCFFVE